MEINIDELLLIIGAKDVENYSLKKKITALEAAVKALTPEPPAESSIDEDIDSEEEIDSDG